MEAKGKENRKSGQAVGRALLKRRSFRRNLLFGSTFLTLVLVFAGAVPLSPFLADSAISFAGFWIVILLLVGFILVLALYDLIQIRAEHRERLRDLQSELAEAADEAQQISEETLALIEEELKKDREDSPEE